MKKFKKLGIISIIAMVVGIAINFDDGLRSFNEGRKEGENSYKSIPDNLYRVSLKVVPIEGISNDSIFNQAANRKVPYQVSEITTYTQPSKWITLVMIISGFSCIAFIIAFILFIQFLFEVSKRNVFCEANVWRIHLEGWVYVVISDT